MDIKYKSNNNIVYSCKYHVVWCPKYCGKVLVGRIEARLKELIKEICVELQSELIELEIPDKQKEIKVPILKKPVAIWNNQNYSIKFGYISFPVWFNGKSTRIVVKTETTNYQINLLLNKLGTLRITERSGKFMAQIAVNAVPRLSETDLRLITQESPCFSYGECQVYLFGLRIS